MISQVARNGRSAVKARPLLAFAGAPRYSANATAAAPEAPDTAKEIFKQSAANKVGLSHALDGVLRGGSHDMKVVSRCGARHPDNIPPRRLR